MVGSESFEWQGSSSGLYEASRQHDACGVGFVAELSGLPSRAVVADALEALARMNHRGAAGAEANTGDGAGLQTAVPHSFLARRAAECGIRLPESGRYAVGNVFFDQKGGPAAVEHSKAFFMRAIKDVGLTPLGWRLVPTDNSALGTAAKRSQPRIEQIFIERPPNVDEMQFERMLFLARR